VVITELHKIFHGDVWKSLQSIHSNSIDCVVTSPPYFNQRDYGFTNQIGLELTLEEYLAKLVSVFHQVRDVLKPEGIFYLNIGDKYLTKYGNSSLGMIPYRLASQLVVDGWILVDTIIWKKTNHMPSSVTNRLTNTYEPVFVLSKSNDNYYTRYKHSKQSRGTVEIPVQPTSFHHMAAFPERLVEELLGYGLPDNATILDPFAGTGTTCKAAQNLNQANSKQFDTLMIEAFSDFVEIIKERCGLKQSNVTKIKGLHQPRINVSKDFLSSKNKIKIHWDSKSTQTNLLIKLTNSSDEADEILKKIYSTEMYQNLSDDGIFFFGLPNNDIEYIQQIAQLTSYKWIVRNMIVIPNRDSWYPIFLLVKDIKSVRYKFDLDRLRIQHKTENSVKFDRYDFIGYQVNKSSTYSKFAQEGFVVKILEETPNGFPKWVLVKWDDERVTVEEIVDKQVTDVDFLCPSCNKFLDVPYHYKNTVSCPYCQVELWRSVESIPILKEVSPRKESDQIYSFDSTYQLNRRMKDYKGKFKGVDNINKGQSPGARSSTNADFFTVKRYYRVDQAMISDYLNLFRVKQKLSKKALTDLFPSSYKHTVGHWLRKDMGGSLPKTEDLDKLALILGLEKKYVNYIQRMALKLQMVLPDTRGKNPGDFWELSKKEIMSVLTQLSS
jgi:site-specific DNA-methyltransferase (adenine-specific)